MRHRKAFRPLLYDFPLMYLTTQKNKMIITDKAFLDKVENELVILHGLIKVLKVASWDAEQQKGDFGLTVSLEILHDRLKEIMIQIMDRRR